MKKIIHIVLILGFVTFNFMWMSNSYAETKNKKSSQHLAKVTNWDEGRIDVGRLWIPITNYGKHGQDKWGHRGEWPGGSSNEYIFGAGVIVSAIVNGIPCATVGYDPNDASSEFTPGAPPNNWPSQSGTAEDDAEIVYFSTDPAHPWPLTGLPANAPTPPSSIVSDMDTWTYFNDLAPGQHKSEFSTPIGVQVVQTTYAWGAKGFEDIVFVLWDLTNIREDQATIHDVYFGPIVDSDIQSATLDMVGFDLSRNMAYQYHTTNTEAGFVRPVGILAYKFLEGPIATKDVDANGDGVINDDSVMIEYHGIAGSLDTLFIKDIKAGERMGLTAFKKFTIQIDPQYDWQRYAMMAGYDYRACSYDVGTGAITLPPDAWAAYDEDDAPEDKRFVQSTGPFDLKAGETVRVVVAIMVNGVDDLSEIEADPLANLKKIQATADLAQTIYNAGYIAPKAPPYPALTIVPGDGKATLLWSDSPEHEPDPYYQIAKDFDPDYVEFDFEGYRIYRSLTGVSGSWKMIAELDKKGDAKERLLTNEATGEAHFVHIGDNTGLQHAYVDSGLTNGLRYYYAVTSYDFQPKSTPVTLESAKSNITSMIPTRPPLGTKFGKITDASHIAGTSDATVQTFIGDYRNLTGHTYHITFSDLGQGDGSVGWNLLDQTSGTTIVSENTMFNLTDVPADIPGVGFSVVVNNPSPGMKGFEIPSGKRWWTWAGGAGAWGFEGFHGAIGWGDNFFTGTTLGPTDIHNVLIKFAATDDNGNLLDANDPNSCMAYRYLRSSGDPARPEFAEFIVNVGSGYLFQDRRRVPLIAIDDETGKQLNVGFLENNVSGGSVDGKYWPPNYADASNTSGSGPREWLFIFGNEYSETDDPILTVPLWPTGGPIMWWCTVARRGAVKPDAGDEFKILANHVASTDDMFEFSTQATEVKAVAADLDKIKVVPNPFIVRNDWMPSSSYGRIYFTNLPEKCTLRIFTIAGDFVQKLEKDDDSGQRVWDVTSYNHQDVASGVYLVHIDAPGIGTKLLKFAVVK